MQEYMPHCNRRSSADVVISFTVSLPHPRQAAAAARTWRAPRGSWRGQAATSLANPVRARRPRAWRPLPAESWAVSWAPLAADEGSAFDTSESYSYATYCVTGNHQVDGLRRSRSTAAGRRFSSFLVSETEARSTLVHLLAVEGCLGGGFRHRK